MIYDWTKVDKNPTSARVLVKLHNILREKNAGKKHNYMAFLKSFVENRRVLDIGVVEHDSSHIQSEKWKHRYIRDWSLSAIGVDILPEEIELLRQQGFNVMNVDATSDVDLGMRFERIVIGEVIEHVENPINLLRFASRHLEDDGRILVTTPNPYWYKYIWQVYRSNTFIANAEHVSWVTPSLAYEMGRRSGLVLDEYWLESPHGRNLINRILCKAANILFRGSELFACGFYYIYRKIDVSGSEI